MAQTAPLEALPFRQQPIDYFGPAANDPIFRLQQRLAAGEARLEFREGSGYLRSVLAALDVPVASQILVFAKNSVHARLIGPDNPRALYFGDDVYVAWVPGAATIELSAVDPQKGAMFYTLRQEPDAPPRLVREESCLLCHASTNTLHVPGHVLRSFLTDPRGNPEEGYSRVDHDLPTARRWGGFYVTGEFGSLPHLGNRTAGEGLGGRVPGTDRPGQRLAERPPFAPERYLSGGSDVVALLVHDHQVHGHNLLTRVNYEERLREAAAPGEASRRSPTLTASEEKLVRYLLFADAAPLAGPIGANSEFAAWFLRQGPRDARGRSLRQLNLQSRLLEYRCSYLIHSGAFAGLPATAKDRIIHRLREILAAESPPEPYDALPADERRAILAILQETLPAWSRSAPPEGPSP